jgi:DNA invertase Pin-like site-specific DNA recombinase
MKTVALYLRVSTVDQHPETQLHDLRAMAQQRDFQIVAEYTDRISGRRLAGLASTTCFGTPAAVGSR